MNPVTQNTQKTNLKPDANQPNERRGQWKCSECSAVNNGVRRICSTCRVARTTWKCKECYEQNVVKDLDKDACKVCNTVAPYVTGRNLNELTGKWTCLACNATNKEQFDECFCARRSTTVDPVGGKLKRIKYPVLPGDWKCVDCEKHNFAKYLKCVLCNALKPMDLSQGK